MRILKALGIAVLAVVAIGAIAYATRSNPMGPIAGRALTGELVSEPVSDWSFSDDHDTIAVETRPAAPHSVTTICFSHEGALYVPALRGAAKSWPHYIVSDPRVRVKIGDAIYPVIASRVTDESLVPALTAAARAKYEFDEGDEAPALEDVWVFRLESPVVVAAVGSPLESAPSPLSTGARRELAEAVVSAEDRSDEDRARDARRRPAELLAFSGIAPGMRVADLGAGSGYTSELWARAVGSEGQVYGQNTPAVIEKYVSESWPARLAKPVMSNVVRLDSGFEAPLPDLDSLDLVSMVFVYHDTLGGIDRAAMNAAILDSLKPGGALVVVDHAAIPGSGEEAGDTVHRIDEALLRSELLAAGFHLVAEADFMRNAEDARDKPFFELETPTDAFVHRYVKPH